MKRRLLTAAAGLILAAVIAGSIVSRQNLGASQSRNHPVAVVAEPSASAAKPSSSQRAVRAPRISKPAQPAPDDSRDPEFSARQTLNGPVRSLWESGRYAEALGLINQVLARDPTDDSALAWKKKVRAAQAAEAALK